MCICWTCIIKYIKRTVHTSSRCTTLPTSRAVRQDKKKNLFRISISASNSDIYIIYIYMCVNTLKVVNLRKKLTSIIQIKLLRQGKQGKVIRTSRRVVEGKLQLCKTIRRKQYALNQSLARQKHYLKGLNIIHL